MASQVATGHARLQAIHIVDDRGQTQQLPYGFVLWASGVGQVPFIKRILSTVDGQKGNRIMKVNEKLQILGMPNCFAMGDCTWLEPRSLAANADKLYAMAKSASATGPSTEWLAKMASTLSKDYPQIAPSNYDMKQLLPKTSMSKAEFVDVLKKIDAAYKPPPPTAQNANQEGRYLATIFNRFVTETDEANAPAYVYQWKGQMAYVGNGQSVVQTPAMGTWLGGRTTNVFWKMFYWSSQMSTTNRLLCTFDWCRAILRGRDVGRDHTKDVLPRPPTPTAAGAH